MADRPSPTPTIIGTSPPIVQALATARALAPGMAPVLIIAEEGLEVTELGMLIHTESGRPGPFHRVFAPKLTSTDRRGEPARGAVGHTPAYDVLHELIGQAQGGTLLIEEIGELPRFGQAIVEDLLAQRIRGVPGTDVRVVASSSMDLQVEVELGRFREGLAARLLVGPVYLPPLRKRRDDIVLLVQHLLRTHPYIVGRPTGGFGSGAVGVLRVHDWPGNLPELEAVMVGALRAAGEGPFRAEHVQYAIDGMSGAFDPLWSDDAKTYLQQPNSAPLRELEPKSMSAGMVTEELAVRVFGREILSQSNAAMKEQGLTLLAIALRRVMAKLEAEGVLHERDLRAVTLLRGKPAPRFIEVLVEDGVLVLAPATGRKRAWKRAPEA